MIDVGKTIGDSIGIVFSRLLPFVLLAVVLDWALNLVLGPAMVEGDTLVRLLSAFIKTMVAQVTTAFFIGAAYQAFQGQDVDIGATVSRAFSVAVWVLLTAIVVALMVALGFLLLIIPGIYLAVKTWLAMPVVVLEKADTGRAIGRSFHITRGAFWPLVVLFLTYFLLMVVLGIVIAFAFGGGGGSMESALERASSPLVVWGGRIVNGVLSVFLGAMSVHVYLQLTSRERAAHPGVAETF